MKTIATQGIYSIREEENEYYFIYENERMIGCWCQRENGVLKKKKYKKKALEEMNIKHLIKNNMEQTRKMLKGLADDLKVEVAEQTFMRKGNHLQSGYYNLVLQNGEYIIYYKDEVMDAFTKWKKAYKFFTSITDYENEI